MKLFTKSMLPNTKLGIAERSAYMCGNFGINTVATVIGSFLMFFYTDIINLDPVTIGTILMISRVFDGITDIIMGIIVDRTHSKKGKGRIWILRMFIPFAISSFLLFCVPTRCSETLQYAYIFITYNLCNSFLLTALNVPYCSMTVNITTDGYERGLLGIFYLLGGTLGALLVSSSMDMATKALGNGQKAWQTVGAVYALISLVLNLICFLGTKERYQEEKQDTKEKLSPLTEVKVLIKNKYWILLIVISLLVSFYLYFINNSLMYYSKAVLGDTAFLPKISNPGTIAQILGVFAVFVPMKKMGKRNTILMGVIIVTLGQTIQCMASTQITILMICSVIKGLGAGMAGGVLLGALADTLDYGAWKTGVKAEGVGMAAYSFTGKVTSGFAGVVVGWVNNFFGYNSQSLIQSERAQFGVKILFNYLPLVCCVIALILLMFYNLDKIMLQINKERE